MKWRREVRIKRRRRRKKVIEPAVLESKPQEMRGSCTKASSTARRPSLQSRRRERTASQVRR